MKVGIPERLGRRMSIGPFEDPRDFLRFMVFASLGALVSIPFGLLWGTPILVTGALLTILRINEETLFNSMARRLAYHLSHPVAPLVGGHVTATGWKDRYGREWRFFSHEPLRIHGMAADEVHATNLELVRAIAEIEGEAILVRISEPWNVGPYVPNRSGRESPELAEYAKLLEESARGLYRARLVLGIFTTEGKRKGGAASLEGIGWRPLTGGALLRSLRLGFPLGPGEERGWRLEPGKGS